MHKTIHPLDLGKNKLVTMTSVLRHVGLVRSRHCLWLGGDGGKTEHQVSSGITKEEM